MIRSLGASSAWARVEFEDNIVVNGTLDTSVPTYGTDLVERGNTFS
jgi:hypothetical protein